MERGRVMGAPEHWVALSEHLTARQVHDAQGNAFDPRAVMCRLGPCIEAWLHGQKPLNRHFPSVAEVWAVYHDMAQELTREGHSPWPFPGQPPEQYNPGRHHNSHGTAAETADNTLAAEHGRRGQ